MREQEADTSEAVHFLFEQVPGVGIVFSGAALVVHSVLPTGLTLFIWAISLHYPKTGHILQVFSLQTSRFITCSSHGLV